MSLDWRTRPLIKTDDLFDGRLEKYGIRADRDPNASPTRGRLTLIDSTNVHPRLLGWRGCDTLGVIGHEDGAIERLSGFSDAIVEAIRRAYHVEVFCDDEPQFYGDFETWEEVRAAPVASVTEYGPEARAMGIEGIAISLEPLEPSPGVHVEDVFEFDAFWGFESQEELEAACRRSAADMVSPEAVCPHCAARLKSIDEFEATLMTLEDEERWLQRQQSSRQTHVPDRV
jgi:hypothetical protein